MFNYSSKHLNWSCTVERLSNELENFGFFAVPFRDKVLEILMFGYLYCSLADLDVINQCKNDPRTAWNVHTTSTLFSKYRFVEPGLEVKTKCRWWKSWNKNRNCCKHSATSFSSLQLPLEEDILSLFNCGKYRIRLFGLWGMDWQVLLATGTFCFGMYVSCPCLVWILFHELPTENLLEWLLF